MKKSTQLIATAIFAGVTIFGSGCAVVRSQESVGAYIDDTTITTQIKSRMASDTRVDAVAISVETLKGVVQLSGFAKSSEEKTVAEQIARDINGVRSVQNSIVIRRP
ncbi:MAG TPA: BON domain-containing protein [Casimicrobium sp.]|jgi:osmotically-inducible protein OsmY|nr:BON domain-containing protein [Casimicrobium sp.]HPT56067.1 BON domain-containing protein [Casimicrobium sp.]